MRNMVGNIFIYKSLKQWKSRLHRGHLGGLLGGEFGIFGSGELDFCSGELVVITGTAGAS